MNRRLLTILLPLAAGTLAASCSTITDNDVVARVDDAELSVDDLGELAAAQGIAADETLDAEVARQLVTEWIRAESVSDDNIAEISGIDVAGITWPGLRCTRRSKKPTLPATGSSAAKPSPTCSPM